MADTEFRPAEAQRLDAFVDAAFAFAVSLLIIAGGQSAASFDDLLHALARIPAFLGGFALIILFWLAHRAWSTLEPRRDGWSTALSLAVVFSVLVFVFPLRLLIESAAHFLSGGALPGIGLITTLKQLSWTYLIYGIGFAILSGLFALLYRHAERTTSDEPRRRAAREWARSWIIATAAGVLSGLVALTPILRAAPWLPGCLYWIIPIGIGLFGWLDRRKAPAT